MFDHGNPLQSSSFNRPSRLIRSIVISIGVAGLLLGLKAMALAAPGDLDPSFGTGGIVITEDFYPYGMAIQPDGKIVVSSRDKLIRYNSDGTLDVTFGSAGVALSQGGGHAVTVQPDGKIVVGGEYFLARFNSTGSLDAGFGSNGVVRVPFATACDDPNWRCTVAAVSIDANSKIVIGGQANHSFAVARYTRDGNLDASFNGAGVTVTEFDHPHFFDQAVAVVILPNGKIIAVGTAVGALGGTFPTKFALARYNVDGTLDNSFGANGRVMTDIDGSFVGSAVRQPDGKIIAVGTGYGLGGRIARYSSEGSLDLTFGNNGIATNSVMSCNPQGAVLQIDGKIVAVDECFHLVRFLPDGQIDSTFGHDGVITSPMEATVLLRRWIRSPERQQIGRCRWIYTRPIE